MKFNPNAVFFVGGVAAIAGAFGGAPAAAALGGSAMLIASLPGVGGTLIGFGVGVVCAVILAAG